MADWKPNARYQHIFVVFRVDKYGDDLEDGVTLTKAFWDRVEAESEVRRLNSMAKPERKHYQWQLARLARPPSEETPTESRDERESTLEVE